MEFLSSAKKKWEEAKDKSKEARMEKI